MDSPVVFLAARVLLASVFIGLGLEGLLRAFGAFPSTGMPASGGVIAFDVFQIVAGVLVIVGWQARWVALALTVFLLVDAFVSHQFWRYSGAEQHGQWLHFLKNMASVGGFLLLAWVSGAPKPR